MRAIELTALEPGNFRCWILDFGFWIDSTDNCAAFIRVWVRRAVSGIGCGIYRKKDGSGLVKAGTEKVKIQSRSQK